MSTWTCADCGRSFTVKGSCNHLNACPKRKERLRLTTLSEGRIQTAEKGIELSFIEPYFAYCAAGHSDKEIYDMGYMLLDK